MMQTRSHGKLPTASRVRHASRNAARVPLLTQKPAFVSDHLTAERNKARHALSSQSHRELCLAPERLLPHCGRKKAGLAPLNRNVTMSTTNESETSRIRASSTRRTIEGLIAVLKDGTHELSDPKAKALFETSAEVLKGLTNAFLHYENQTEEAWKDTPPPAPLVAGHN